MVVSQGNHIHGGIHHPFVFGQVESEDNEVIEWMKRWYNGGYNKQRQHQLVEAALLSIGSVDAPKSKIPKKNSPVSYEPSTWLPKGF